MTRALLTPHDRASVLIVGRRIAAELAEAALDPASTLPHSVRAALAGLVLAVDREAHRRAGVPLPDAGTREALALALPAQAQPRPP